MRAKTAPIACLGLALAVSGCGAEDSGVLVPWARAVPSADGRLLKIGYESDPCTRARKARVTSNGRVITVTLSDPERDREELCIQTVKPGCVTVRLMDPVGRRRVSDGAPNRFPQSKRGLEHLPFSRYGRCTRVPVDG